MTGHSTVMLVGWKEIIEAINANISTRTAQRWIKAHGLPVRQKKGQAVVASLDEIESWKRNFLNANQTQN